jgi:hypothetical protein
LVAGCANEPSLKTVELFDDSNGMTSGALIEPIAFMEKRVFDLLAPDKQPGTAFLGPVEWDRGGDYTYGLWLQVSPGVDGSRIDDIHGRGAVSLRLDDGVLPLTSINQAQAPKAPYRLAPTGGQSAYFSIDIAMLQRIASSRTVVLDLRAADLSAAEFIPTEEVHGLIERFIEERDIN